MRVGLLFGSFDPVHRGHLQLGRVALQEGGCREVWYVLTPVSPTKQRARRLSAWQRLLLLRLALWRRPLFRVLDVELHRSAPHYTVETLRLLKQAYPKHQFVLIIGADTLKALPEWKEGAYIFKSYPILVYQRRGTRLPSYPNTEVHLLKGDPLSYSSTEIRHRIQTSQEITDLLPEAVYRYIKKKQLYG